MDPHCRAFAVDQFGRSGPDRTIGRTMPECRGGEITVTLPRALLALFADAPATVELRAARVSDMIDALDERWPGMRDRLCDSRPAIRRHINIFVAGNRARLDTPLAAGTKVDILTAMRG
jgi:hypothetical protein